VNISGIQIVVTQNDHSTHSFLYCVGLFISCEVREKILADRTARSIMGYWHHLVDCASWLNRNDAPYIYSKSVWTTE